jgi:hypothetical protein
MRVPASSYRKPPTNPFLRGSVVRRPVFSGFPIPHGVCLMFRLEQVWRERISWLQSSGLTVAAGRSFDSSASRRATAGGPATVVSLQMNAQSLRQGDRRPNGKPQTLPSSPAVPLRAAGRLWCEVSSSDLPNRLHDDRTDKCIVPPRT